MGWFNSKDTVFWGEIKDILVGGIAAASVTVPIKGFSSHVSKCYTTVISGCLNQTTQVKIRGLAKCKLAKNQVQ